MFDRFYIVENGTITGTVKRGGSFNGKLLGKDMSDSAYQGLGLYGVIDEQPTLVGFQRLGNQVRIIDDVNKTVTDTFDVVSLTQSEIYEVENNKALATLRQIDFESIRAIREYIASRPDAPQILKDKEEAAAAERAKLKP